MAARVHHVNIKIYFRRRDTYFQFLIAFKANKLITVMSAQLKCEPSFNEVVHSLIILINEPIRVNIFSIVIYIFDI